jgi:predicted nucleic acid-binding Zn ribbon protein
MDLYISSNIRNSLIIVILAIVVLVLVFVGISNGKRQAKSALILNWASEETLALEYFYRDNNRFPTADEFARPEVMGNYFVKAPEGVNIQTEQCPEILKYIRPRTENYELYFCLPRAQDGYNLGLNQFVR